MSLKSNSPFLPYIFNKIVTKGDGLPTSVLVLYFPNAFVRLSVIYIKSFAFPFFFLSLFTTLTKEPATCIIKISTLFPFHFIFTTPASESQCIAMQIYLCLSSSRPFLPILLFLYLLRFLPKKYALLPVTVVRTDLSFLILIYYFYQNKTHVPIADIPSVYVMDLVDWLTFLFCHIIDLFAFLANSNLSRFLSSPFPPPNLI